MAASDSAPYPWELGRTVHLRNDRCVWLRAIRPEDETGLRALFDRLSPATVYQRFFRAWGRLPDDWFQHFANVDYARRLALVAEAYTLDGPRLVGVARYEPTDIADVAEVAVVIEDAWQGLGLGHLLLGDLFAAAEARGIHRFQADILSENRRMLTLLTHVARIESSSTEMGVTELTFVPTGR